MPSILNMLIPLIVGTVAFILLFGLVNLVRSRHDPHVSINLSQKLMRWRVGMQLVAVCLIMASFYFKHG